MKPGLSGGLSAFRFVAAPLQLTCLALAIQAPAIAQEGIGGRRETQACGDKDAGITLPPDFCATVFADSIGHARHMAIAPDGVVYVNTWSGSYYGRSKTPPGGFIVALRDTKGGGHADVIKRFGESPVSGGSGGTGIALYKGALYAEEGDRILRYALPPGSIAPSGPPEVIISGLPVTGDHPMHPFAIDAQGNLYVDSGSATNSCQAENRMLKSPGLKPCKELETRGGIWRYDANKTGQKFSPAGRFATGLRNGEGIAFDEAGRIFATQHGRDQLAENWPEFYRPVEGANEPAEELVELTQDGDYGWPGCYFDYGQQKLVLAPEYGGDGGKTAGPCAQKLAPVASFPAHWAPNDLLVYQGAQFPAAYRGGAFIAFHGSWNRAAFPQGGYNVVFQPLADGRPSGRFVVFADGFAGAVKTPDAALHRPSGLAMGPDGALFISDDVRGRIWRVTFHGDAAAAGVEPAPSSAAQSNAPEAAPPEGINPEAGAAENLPVPPGATPSEVALGSRIFHGQAAGGTCAGCHGTNGKGSPVGPDLTTGKWLWGDGTMAAITRTITGGVAQPKEYRNPMPPLGGTQLTPPDVAAVSAYVWAIGHAGGR